ncbi:hypothetical protein PIB30_094201 [Stylosanthes scabra]|uniref:Transposase (putative) gypsy type domain-containing protein n=1 Tax=Stylosanthes scabra TaxID=79078 RepID=A0ABU6YWQ6_9FABA|nr:hypothetical protein [Stylosanthes scabra]
MEVNRLTDENGKPIIPIAVDDPYSWVKGEVRDLVSLLCDEESVAELGEPSVWVREGEGICLEFLPCSSGDRVFHKAGEWEYFYMYTTIFIDLGVRFPFSEFVNGVLSQLKCAPSQIHPNAWGFIRGFEILMEYLGQEPLLEVFFSFFQAKGVRKGGLVTLSGCQGRSLFSLYRSSYKDFKQMFIKVRSSETEFPFYIDGCLLERFPLYWYSEPVKVLGMEEVNEKSALVIDFLVQYLCRKEPLSLNRLLKYNNRWVKELSASNVVKAERGMEVNQPSVRRRNISVKRMRAEETSGKEKLIDLMSSKCCGRDVSLDEVKSFTENQKKLHGYLGSENLSSVWSEHFPITVVAEEHFQSKAELRMLVMAARLWCMGRYEELKGKKEMEHKKEESAELQRSMERERKLQLALEQVALKEKELLDLKSENGELKGKKEAETGKEHHGYEMLLVGFERAKKQANFFFPEMEFDKLDPIKVVHNGALVDDDEVEVEGGDDHNLEA